MAKKPVLLDGGVGTSLVEIAKENQVVDKRPVWIFNMTHPEFVLELGKRFLEAGSEAVLANTFGANRISVEHFSDYKVEDVVREGVRLEKEVVKGTGAKVVLGVGMLADLLKPIGPVSEEECSDIYREQIGTGVREGVDAVYLQTFFDLKMMEIAAREALKFDVPVYCTMTFAKKHKTMMGNTVRQIIDTLVPLGISGIGMNCTLGPDKAVPIMDEFRQYTDLPLVFKPNSGKPELNDQNIMVQPYSPERFVQDIRPSLSYVSYVGGCCGCNWEYIARMRKEIDSMD